MPSRQPPRTPPTTDRLGADPAEQNVEVIDEARADGFHVEVLAFKKLTGLQDFAAAQSLYFAHEVGVRLKQVRITLDDSEALTEAGALHFVHGKIELAKTVGGVGGIGRAAVNKYISKEAAFLPLYKGTGRIYLEPSFGHFLIHQLDGEEIIADKGMFYCGQGGLKVGAAAQKSITAGVFGGEGWFQTSVKGHGLCVFESVVPAEEIRVVDLNDETLRVDGDFALMRTGDVSFTVERASKDLVGMFTSGEGLLQTFRGTGRVWLAPTQALYERMEGKGLKTRTAPGKSSHTGTKKGSPPS